jgi:hypothetical protein
MFLVMYPMRMTWGWFPSIFATGDKYVSHDIDGDHNDVPVEVPDDGDVMVISLMMSLMDDNDKFHDAVDDDIFFYKLMVNTNIQVVS